MCFLGFFLFFNFHYYILLLLFLLLLLIIIIIIIINVIINMWVFLCSVLVFLYFCKIEEFTIIYELLLFLLFI